MKPSFSITINGQAVTDRFKPRLISLELVDKRGLEADEFTITLSDDDNKIALPPAKAIIKVALGFNNVLIDKGTFILTGVEHTGAPDQLTLRALSADIKETFKKQKTKSWHKKTIQQIVATIAKAHQLEAVVNKDLGATIINHIDQTDESDSHFLTRLSEHYDALATIKAGKLLFMQQGKGTTAKGTPLPSVIVKRSDGDNHQYSRDDQQARYTGVLAYYHSHSKAKRKKVTVGEEGHRKHLRASYANEAEAKTAAQSAWDKLQRGVESFTPNLAVAKPELIPEQPIKAQGWKKQINNKDWIAKTVTHSIEESYTMSIALELKI